MNAAIPVTMAILFTYLTGKVAMRRGHAVKAWHWIGALFGPFALIAVFLLPRSHKKAAA